MKQNWLQDAGLQETAVIHSFLCSTEKMIWIYEQLKKGWGKGVLGRGVACVDTHPGLSILEEGMRVKSGASDMGWQLFSETGP